jgi:hypothetical protein
MLILKEFHMKQKALGSTLALCLPLVSGCFNVEQALRLNANLSGEAGFSVKMNMEPLAAVLLGLQREMSGQRGDAAALAAEREGKGRTWRTQRFPPRAVIERNLPPGVKLLGTSISDEGLGMGGQINLAFDDVSKLSQIRVPEPTGGGVDDKTPFEQPFPFEIKDDGSTVLLTMAIVDPLGHQKVVADDMKLPAALQQQVEAAFNARRIGFTLTTPLAVVEHNATRTDGQTLHWEYDVKALEKMTAEQRAQGVRVRLKK